MNEWNSTPQFEESVRQSFGVPEIRSEFVDQVYDNLMQRVAIKSQKRRPLFGLRPAWTVALAILLLLIIGTLVIGPQRVYAAIQSLFGYVPGVGFVSTDSAAALREPVELTQNGQTLQVEQLLSSNKETILVLRLKGFPAYQNIDLDHGIWLELADGSALLPHSYGVGSTGNPGEYTGVFKFHTLPAGVRQVSVLWKQSSSAQSSEPVNWKIPVTLYPLSDTDVAKLLPNSYEPDNASSTRQGITLKIDLVSSSPAYTAVRIQMIFPEVFDFVSPNSAVLIDELGMTYQIKNNQVNFDDNGQAYRILTTPGSTPQVFKNLHETLEFFAIDPSAKQLTLQVDQLSFRASPYTTFTVDLGSHPSAGDSWPINQILTIEDLSLRVNSARLESLENDAPGSNGNPILGLVLDLEPIDPHQAKLDQIWIRVEGAQEVYDKATYTWASAWSPDKVPTGIVDINLDKVQGILFGEWKIQWDQQEP